MVDRIRGMREQGVSSVVPAFRGTLRRPMPALLLWLGLSGLGGLIAGCGQKGPLTLPASSTAASAGAHAASAASK